ncbi:hypothetical protein BDR03DRAFT_970926 [Suillus americanus]|nr:hypothetical protein BDR03DRAFT_970926 [Suillus americanus]
MHSYWTGHGLQGKLRPNFCGGRRRLYLSRTDYDTLQDYRLRARTPAPAPGPGTPDPTCPAGAPRSNTSHHTNGIHCQSNNDNGENDSERETLYL